MTREEFLFSDENKVIDLFSQEVVDILSDKIDFNNFLFDFKKQKTNLTKDFKIEYKKASSEVKKILLKDFEKIYVDYVLYNYVPKIYVKYFLNSEYKNILLINEKRITGYLIKEEKYEQLVLLKKITQE